MQKRNYSEGTTQRTMYIKAYAPYIFIDVCKLEAGDSMNFILLL